MKNIYQMYAHSFREKNEAIYALLDRLSHEEREKDRASYYKSLSNLFRHVLFGQQLFMDMFRGALGAESAAAKALERLKGLGSEEGALSEAQWKALKTRMAEINAALIGFAEALEPAECAAPVTIAWYGGKPPAVPLSFLFHQMAVHTVHHEGQISQILDELKIEHNYASINVAFMPDA